MIHLPSLVGVHAGLIGSIPGFKRAAAELEVGGRARASLHRGQLSFDATTIPSAQMHGDAESEQYLFDKNILVFDVCKGS